MNKIKILFLASNPNDTLRLKLSSEYRQIREVIKKSNNSEQVELHHLWDVRSSDLQELLLDYRPDIVHFSGHGNKSSEIILQDETGYSTPISKEALKDLFRILRSNIKCVVLNLCYSESQALAISDNIDFVIGISNAIHDQDAINFSKAFYRGLLHEESMGTSFELGDNEIKLSTLEDKERPKLISRNNNEYEFYIFKKKEEKIVPPKHNTKGEVAGAFGLGFLLAKIADWFSDIDDEDDDADNFD